MKFANSTVYVIATAILATGVNLTFAAESHADKEAALVPHLFKKGDPLRSAEVNENFEAMATELRRLQAQIASSGSGGGPSEFPAGAIVAFAGPATNTPPAWSLCNGSARRSTDYPALFRAIRAYWGDGRQGECLDADGHSSSGCDFNLPDLRGQFLRGVDPNALRDKDVASRSDCAAGRPSSGTEVGTCQSFATRAPTKPFTIEGGAHSHGGVITISKHSKGPVASRSTDVNRSTWDGTGDNTRSVTEESTSHKHTISGGDVETRPSNAAVNYLIRMR